MPGAAQQRVRSGPSPAARLGGGGGGGGLGGEAWSPEF